MTGNLISLLTSLGCAIKYQSALGIKRGEYRRYLTKSLNLALCYVGFVPKFSAHSYVRVGQAAFLCCAYDVITDWRGFDAKLFEWYERLLVKKVPGNIANLALKLYEDESKGRLGQDGLSRGVVALEFITKLADTYEYIESRLNFTQLGIVLQVIDDVLDLEDDIRECAINCLLTERREEYLQMLISYDFNHAQKILPNGRILFAVAHLAKNKAILLLEKFNAERFNAIPVETNL